MSRKPDMKNRIIIGNTYGELKVLSKGDKYRYYNCVCKNGHKTSVRADHLSKDKKCRTCSIEQSHIGEVINGIEIVKYSHSDKTGNKYYWFKCYCGNDFLSIYSFVNSGHTRSCGCLTNKYGNLSKDPRYRNWVAMVQRTTNKNHKAYKHYHDIIQGTVIEKSWVESPEEFYKEIGEKPGKNYTIDRINNSKGYVRGNVKWSTRSEQQLNRFTKRGETGEKYIYKDKRRNAYVAYAYNKTIGMKYLGQFSTKNEAIAARDKYLEK